MYIMLTSNKWLRYAIFCHCVNMCIFKTPLLSVLEWVKIPFFDKKSDFIDRASHNRTIGHFDLKKPRVQEQSKTHFGRVHYTN